jgi:site-specific DNA-cytosine methylase
MILLRSDQFGLPQRRTRLFILGVNKRRAASELQNTPEDVLDNAVRTYLPKFKTTPPPVVSFRQNKQRAT